ncbi:hypothetical protein GCM10022247_12000 [Allokutzneria multivorans]|uniref:Uncharacterized protein n=1 Tax=Allokutzneria multivorans TaxID=1142134 RepID=A0ABP7R8M8_9PSEU
MAPLGRLIRALDAVLPGAAGSTFTHVAGCPLLVLSVQVVAPQVTTEFDAMVIAPWARPEYTGVGPIWRSVPSPRACCAKAAEGASRESTRRTANVERITRNRPCHNGFDISLPFPKDGGHTNIDMPGPGRTRQNREIPQTGDTPEITVTPRR